MSMNEIFGEPISIYTRAQAIDDGILVEVDPTISREAGIKFPVAMTAAVYAECVKMNSRAERACNDVTGRLWDVLWMLRNACRTAQGSTLFFTVHVVTPSGRGIKPQAVRLKAVCGPADDLSPCLTVMFPEED